MSTPGLRSPTTGTLGKTPLVHLLVYAGDKLLSGTFEMSTQGGESAALTVREGKVGKVRTSKPVAYLGMVLYERGILDDQELNASLALVASQRALHGSILLDRGTVTRPQLIAALREQTLRKLAYMFG
ncbi:MAG TPA: hypothetical protein VGY54_10150, partial [Polyangiaceae bacterium]|nr:hypothetical protein [Polyangiaceae bacterium]